MRFDDMLNAIQEYRSAIDDPKVVSELIWAAYRDQLLGVGIGKLALLENGRLIVNVRGQLKGEPRTAGAIDYYRRFFAVDLDWFIGKTGRAADAEHRQFAQVLEAYEWEGDGAYVWVVPDGYMASLTEREQQWAAEGGGYFSHESICVLNTSEVPTRCTLEVFYESDTSRNFAHEFEVGPRQSVHYRLDKLVDDQGNPLILKDEPVAYRITSHDARVVVQGSRILTSGEDSEFASFGTAIAWTPVE